MYICPDCGLVFAEPELVRQAHGPEHNQLEALSCCPFCGEAYEDLGQCCGCRDFYSQTDLSCGFCLKCTKKIEAEFKQLIKDNFTPPEIKYLEYADLF